MSYKSPIEVITSQIRIEQEKRIEGEILYNSSLTMELKRDEIIKALECCTTINVNVKNCGDCPLKDKACTVTLPQNALSLIKELTEENERQRSEISVKRKLLDKAEVRMDCLEEVNKVLQADICNATMNLEHLTKENERLSAYNENLIKANTYFSNHLLDEVEQAKDLAISDTLSEFKNRLAQAIGTYTNKDYVYVYAWFKLIDQIAKEMVEGV